MISDIEILEHFVLYVANKDGFSESGKKINGAEAWRQVQSSLSAHTNDDGKATIELLRSWITAGFKDVIESFWRLESKLFPLTYKYEAGRLQKIAQINNPKDSSNLSKSLFKDALGYDTDGFVFTDKDPYPWPRYVNGVDHFLTALVCRVAKKKEGTAYSCWQKWGLFFALVDCECCEQLNEKAFTIARAISQEDTDVRKKRKEAFALSSL